MLLSDALRARMSVRAFKPDPVPRETIEALLQEATRAPSGTNIQPWKVHVVAGEMRDRLVAEVLAYRDAYPEDDKSEFPRPPGQRKEPYVGRARTLGKAMYGLIGIPKGDKAANFAQWGRNYKFFDAPVGLIFTIDKDLGPMSYLDVGLYIQTLMLCATARGLGTCAQGAWNQYHTATRRVLNVPDGDYIICGVSLGYPDETAPVNTLVADREPVESFTTWHGI
ncbi:Nitrobenzene nitroreductase [Alphaproteobacteria bacterium SO-S41]|nr:Nitrobenzene nitroreductase [Alphaproteobacteria bacterium SO-S41]